jgi:protein-glucosylgalactosylhydroxylysine glucosidase
MAARFRQTLEVSPRARQPKPASGPFFANLGAFLLGLLRGFPGLRLGPGEPEPWPSPPLVLPAGWRSIEVERLGIREQPMRLVARHGARRAELLRPAGARNRAAA